MSCFVEKIMACIIRSVLYFYVLVKVCLHFFFIVVVVLVVGVFGNGSTTGRIR